MRCIAQGRLPLTIPVQHEGLCGLRYLSEQRPLRARECLLKPSQLRRGERPDRTAERVT
jgi:hypothetical protein